MICYRSGLIGHVHAMHTCVTLRARVKGIGNVFPKQMRDLGNRTFYFVKWPQHNTTTVPVTSLSEGQVAKQVNVKPCMFSKVSWDVGLYHRTVISIVISMLKCYGMHFLHCFFFLR